MITNEEKIILANNRLDILNLDTIIVQKEIDFYRYNNLEDKVSYALYKLEQIPLKIQSIQQELNRLTT